MKPYERIGMKEPAPWMPCTDPVLLAVFSKLQEELAEASKEIARCISMGPNMVGPGESKTNIELLLKELADVKAMVHVLHEEFWVDSDKVEQLEIRTVAKIAHKQEWLAKIRAELQSKSRDRNQIMSDPG